MSDLRHTAILLVEDNEDDAFEFSRSMRKAGIKLPFYTVTDGQLALDYLNGTGLFTDRDMYPFPSIIFLDLKLPYVSGMEVLSYIRKESTFRDLSVVILSGSDEARDHQRVDELGIDDYVVKPISLDRLVRLLQESPPAATVSS